MANLSEVFERMPQQNHKCNYISETNPPKCIVCSKVDPSYNNHVCNYMLGFTDPLRCICGKTDPSYNMNNGHVCKYVLESLPPKCVCGKSDPSYDWSME